MNRECALETGHKGKCVRLTAVAIPPSVATSSVATPAEQKVLKAALIASVDVKHPGKLTEGARVQKWREANRERYNKRMSEYRKRKKPTGIAYG